MNFSWYVNYKAALLVIGPSGYDCADWQERGPVANPQGNIFARMLEGRAVAAYYGWNLYYYKIKVGVPYAGEEAP